MTDQNEEEPETGKNIVKSIIINTEQHKSADTENMEKAIELSTIAKIPELTDQSAIIVGLSVDPVNNYQNSTRKDIEMKIQGIKVSILEQKVNKIDSKAIVIFGPSNEILDIEQIFKIFQLTLNVRDNGIELTSKNWSKIYDLKKRQIAKEVNQTDIALSFSKEQRNWLNQDNTPIIVMANIHIVKLDLIKLINEIILSEKNQVETLKTLIGVNPIEIFPRPRVEQIHNYEKTRIWDDNLDYNIPWQSHVNEVILIITKSLFNAKEEQTVFNNMNTDLWQDNRFSELQKENPKKRFTKRQTYNKSLGNDVSSELTAKKAVIEKHLDTAKYWLNALFDSLNKITSIAGNLSPIELEENNLEAKNYLYSIIISENITEIIDKAIKMLETSYNQDFLLGNADLEKIFKEKLEDIKKEVLKLK